MKILVVAATGKLGQTVTRQALDAGHEVVALVRTPAKLEDLRERVTVVEGDITDVAAIEKAMHGVQAVIWCAGPTRGSTKPETFGEGMHLVTEAMRRNHVLRIVAISGSAMTVAGDEADTRTRMMRAMMQMMPIPIVACNRAQYDALVDSDREWVVVRSASMRDGPPLGNFRADAHHDVGGKVSRIEVADFMLAQLTSDQWVRKAPCVASG